MAEYVEREAAIEYARLHYCKDCNSYNGIRCGSCGFDDAILLIEDAPAADVVEVRRGEWEEYWDDNYLSLCHKCSECGSFPLTKEETVHDEVLSAYCPHCGAKMDGKGVSHDQGKAASV